MMFEHRIRRLESTLKPAEEFVTYAVDINGQILPCSCGRPLGEGDLIPPSFKGLAVQIMHYVDIHAPDGKSMGNWESSSVPPEKSEHKLLDLRQKPPCRCRVN